ncbi:MAG: type II secretion system protein GspJ [Deltaproteobacteria bacterium]
MTVKKAFTLVEVLIAVSIFTIIMALVLAGVAGMFNSLRKAQKIIEREQKQRFFLLRLSKEISSLTRIIYPAMRFKGEANQFFFVFAREDVLVESGYACSDPVSSLAHYWQEPADYNWDTHQNQETSLDNLSKCGFAYSDGAKWKENWEEDTQQFPRAIKINFKFKDEDREHEFIVNIPVSR